MENTTLNSSTFDDLKYLKKHYGEKFAHLCRSLFPTILEEKGLLSSIIIEKFAPTHSLYDDIINENLEGDFKNFIYSFVDVENNTPTSNKTPKELLSEAGYILYPECRTEWRIRSFKKYYAKGEELCTFYGGRLESCRVWFAVKKNVKEIKRENFPNPTRQDEYGTSVISIQFTRSNPSTLSIKNRYNHMVFNSDATFSNNLDNIILGLTEAFTRTYNINLVNTSSQTFDSNNYILAKDGKYYRKNIEYNRINFCENNTLINSDGLLITFDKSRYLFIDNYLIDKQNKKIKVCDGTPIDSDSFVKSIGKIRKIEEKSTKYGKLIIITPEGENAEKIEIGINSHNQIISYKNPNVTEIENNFLPYNKTLTSIEIQNVTKLGDAFLLRNNSLTSINLPNVTFIGDDFLLYDKSLTSINLPKITMIAGFFLLHNKHINRKAIYSKIENNKKTNKENAKKTNKKNTEKTNKKNTEKTKE